MSTVTPFKADVKLDNRRPVQARVVDSVKEILARDAAAARQYRAEAKRAKDENESAEVQVEANDQAEFFELRAKVLQAAVNAAASMKG